VRQLPEAVIQLLQDQHGVATRAQLFERGMSKAELRRMTNGGHWELVAPKAVGVVGHRETWVRALWVAHLHAGPESVISDEAAARLHRIEQVRRGIVCVTVPAGRGPGPSFAAWRRRSDLAPGDVTEVAGMPVTTIARTVVDLAGSLHVARLRLVVEDLLVTERCTLEAVGSTLDRVRRSGRRGVVLLDRVLDDLGPVGGLPHSELERLADEVVARAGLPAPHHEHPLPGRGAVSGFVDRCWSDTLLILEADGRIWHERRQQMVRDADRNIEALRAGYETVRMCWEHLAHDPDGSAEALREIYHRRALLLGHTARRSHEQ
jgi:hypothetical protein